MDCKTSLVLLLLEHNEMKKNLFVMTLSALMAGLLSLNTFAYAEDMQAAEEAIKAECKEESQSAETPELYYEECVADRMQALKDEQGGSGDAAPERG